MNATIRNYRNFNNISNNNRRFISILLQKYSKGSNSNNTISNCSTRFSNIIIRYHNTNAGAAAATLSKWLPSTKDELRIPKTQNELSERMRPLENFLNVNHYDLFNNNTSQQQRQPILTKEQIKSILELPLPGQEQDHETKQILQSLYTAANLICNIHHGDKVHYRGLLEFSNICHNDCYYCGIRKSMPKNASPERYLLDKNTILETARWCASKGYGSIMLQSGEVITKQRIDKLCDIIQTITTETGLGVSISVGELPDEYYKQLKNSGAKRYLLRIETSNPQLFQSLHPNYQTYEKRLDRLRALKRIGYMVGTGVMIGLPNQTINDLVNDIIFFYNENIDMIGMGPYILQRNTPTGQVWKELHPELYQATIHKENNTATDTQLELLDIYASQMFDITTRMIAVCRIILQNVNIAATTALQTIHPTGREVALMRGANILMPILTPTSHRTFYQLYEGKVCVEENAKQCQSCLELRVAAAGKTIAYNEHGDPPHYFNNNNNNNSNNNTSTTITPLEKYWLEHDNKKNNNNSRNNHNKGSSSNKKKVLISSYKV